MTNFSFRVLTSPDETSFYYGSTTVFLAGGISGCPDWQEDFIDLCLKEVKARDNLVLVNPRRIDFDVTNKLMSEQQIEWEHRYLQLVDTVVFWFPEETLCPITLFELGASLHSDKRVVVGTHPDYARRFDVVTQIRLEDSTINVVFSLEDLVKELFTK